MLQLNKRLSLCEKRKRVGRGGSRGGTSGKGHKGQKARSGGKVRLSFEGGQMPLTRRLPKRGFNNTRFKTEVKIVNLQLLNEFFNDGDKIDKKILLEKGVLSGKGQNRHFKLKILAEGVLSKKLIITADSFSQSAEKAIKEVGGQVILTKEI